MGSIKLIKSRVLKSEVVDAAICDLLKNAAINGDTVESMITDVFTELYSDDPGPVLGEFSLLLLTKMNLKKTVGKNLLTSLHSASEAGRDIYEQVEFLNSNAHKKVNRHAYGITHNARMISQA